MIARLRQTFAFAAVLGMLVLTMLTAIGGWPGESAAQEAVGAAVETAGEGAGVKQANTVTIGLYINDIQDIDFRTNSFLADIYLWFRWKGGAIDPSKTVEFMNVYAPYDSQKTVLLDQPKTMPDGSNYNIVRYQGRFAKKFDLSKYPFDSQSLDIVIEDSVSPIEQQVFAADTRAVGMNPSTSLPGFKFSSTAMRIFDYAYPTNFGDLSLVSGDSYSRAVVSIPMKRPMFTLTIKTFGPIALIVICATLVFFINPSYVEGRIGLAITALLTLVAIQLTAGSSLPEADYFTMLDKLYMLSYAFIIAALIRVVAASWHPGHGYDSVTAQTARADHRWGVNLLLLYIASAAAVAAWALMR